YMGWNTTNSTGYAVYHWDTTGSSGNYTITCNITDWAAGYYNDTSQNSDSRWFNITAAPFYLEAYLYEPVDDQIVGKDRLFTVNATVVCRNATCGTIYGTVRYNKTTSSPDTPINETPDTPFWIPSGVNTQNCTNLLENQSCNLIWSVNASGGFREKYEIGVRFTGSGVTNDTASSTVEIGKVLILNLTFDSIDFGEHDPGTENVSAPGNANNQYNITVEPNSNDVEWLWIRSTNLTHINYENSPSPPSYAIIPATSIKWSNQTNNITSAATMDNNYQLMRENVPSNTTINTYYWISVPTGKAHGVYKGVMYIFANATY
ncbi:MAG: hypothetical protein J7K31_03805, partial [Candidatus Aenigmarchaeota archaeon]|nr:hypothetical protein [Candidatus Aenigmarchaeota archaeon]